MISRYYSPTRVLFGQGAENEVGRELKLEGAKKVLIHYGGSSAEKSGLLNKVRDDLKEHGIRFIELGGVQPNPRISLARKGVELCKENGLEVEHSWREFLDPLVASWLDKKVGIRAREMKHELLGETVSPVSSSITLSI